MSRLACSRLALVVGLFGLATARAQVQSPDWVARQIRDRDAGRDSRADMRMRLFDRQKRVANAR